MEEQGTSLQSLPPQHSGGYQLCTNNNKFNIIIDFMIMGVYYTVFCLESKGISIMSENSYKKTSHGQLDYRVTTFFKGAKDSLLHRLRKFHPERDPKKARLFEEIYENYEK